MRSIDRLTLGLSLLTALGLGAVTAALIGTSSSAEPRPTSPKEARPVRLGEGPAYRQLGETPVLHVEEEGSRIKPIDTYARLTVKEVYGREEVKLPATEDRPAQVWSSLGALVDWPAQPAFWDGQEIILIDMFDYRPFKEHVLAESVRAELESIAAKPGTKKADAEAIRQASKAEAFGEKGLEELLAKTSLPDADRKAIEAWVEKLGEGHKWIAPADLEAAEVVVDGRRMAFLDWFGEILSKGQDARDAGETFEPTPREKKVYDVGARLVTYQAFRDRNPRQVPTFEVRLVPRPYGPEYLTYTGKVVRSLIKGGESAGEILRKSPLARDAWQTLQSYLEDIRSVRGYVESIASGSQKAPGEDPKFDRNFSRWLQSKSAWVPLRVVLDADLAELAEAGFAREKVEAFRAAYEGIQSAERSAPGAMAQAPAAALVAAARDLGTAENPESYPSAQAMARETHFNRFAPFAKAPIAYGVGLVLLLLSLGINARTGSAMAKLDRVLYGLGLLAFVAGIGLEVYGFYLRVLISGWAPVTNMYETVIWVAAVAAILGLVLELIFRRKYAAVAATGMALLATLLAANIPLMDSNIKSLPPVLRDNFWLGIHVLTIVSSYAAFSLALGLGLLGIGYYLSATYRRDVPFGDVGRPLLVGLPLALVGLAGLMASAQGWGGGLFSGNMGKIAIAAVGLPGGLLMVCGLFGVMGELANRRSGDALIVGLVALAAGLVGVFGAMRVAAPAWWPAAIPATFPPGILAICGFSLAVMSRLGAQSRGVLLEAQAAAQGDSAIAGGAEADSAFSVGRDEFRAAAGAGGGAVATLERPTVDEIRERAASNRPKLDPRTLAMQAVASQVKPLSNFIYRAMQVGVLLVAAGTILGGVWADVSWGRFWGWDPKEVWALITLLVYLVPLHGRFAGWVSTFGLVGASVICYSAVLMAWYGVNFVLGVGLHSYGFTEGGGQGVVISTGLAVVAIVGAAGWRRSLGSRTSHLIG